MADRCVDCGDRPRLHDLGSCYSETFAVRAPNGVGIHLTLRLCLRCGGRFQDRARLREYLRTQLPQYTVQVAPAAG